MLGVALGIGNGRKRYLWQNNGQNFVSFGIGSPLFHMHGKRHCRMNSSAPFRCAVCKVLLRAWTAFKGSSRNGESTAVNLQHASNGVVETSAFIGGRVYYRKVNALLNVEHGLTAVAYKLVSVEVYYQIGADVGNAGGDNYRFACVVGNFNVGVAVLNCADKFFHVSHFNLVGNNVFQIAAVVSARGFLFGKESAVGKGKTEQRYYKQTQKHAQQYVLYSL